MLEDIDHKNKMIQFKSASSFYECDMHWSAIPIKPLS